MVILPEKTMTKDTDTLTRAYEAWMAASHFRECRERQKRYTYGDQWIDLVDDHAGGRMTERDLLLREGRRPLTNNLLRRMVKTIVGLYRRRVADSGRYDGGEADLHRINFTAELDARMLEEYVISGCAVQRVYDENRLGRYGIWVDNVDPRRFFCNSFSDPRGFDIDLVGMLHDMSPAQLFNRFGRGSRRTLDELTALMGSEAAVHAEDILGLTHPDAMEFFSSRSGTLRVAEVWQLVGKPTTSRGRLRMDMRWRCRWIAPDGTVLDEHQSVYPHGSHPFVVKFYPLIDGEVHSFVEDVIDQQRTINRHLVLADSILATSAKGTLLFPVSQLVKGLTLDDVGRLWSRPDSVIPVSGAAGAMPSQVVTSTAGSPAYSMLDLHMKLFDKTSGVNDALLGNTTGSGVGERLYNAQVENSSTVLADLLDSFTTFVDARDAKLAALAENLSRP